MGSSEPKKAKQPDGLSGQSFRDIRIGLACADSELEALLEQIGVDFDRLSNRVHPSEAPFSCILLNGPMNLPQWSAEIRNACSGETYTGAQAGATSPSGAEFAILDLTGEWFRHPIKQSTARGGVSANDPMFGYLSDLPSGSVKCRTSKAATYLNGSVFVEKDAAYAWCGWPLTPSDNPRDARPLSYPMPSPANSTSKSLTTLSNSTSNTSPLPAETVRSYPHAISRHILLTLLVTLHRRIGLPLVHKWFYPDDADSVFLFRVDSDWGDRESVESLRGLLKKWSIPSTWFLHTSAHAGWLDTFFGDTLLEPAVHASRHKTHKEIGPLKNDIQRALDDVQQASLIHSGTGKEAEKTDSEIEISGFAAPYGAYTEALHRLLTSSLNGNLSGQRGNLTFCEEFFNFEYSSEFGFSRDDLPIGIAVGGGSKGVDGSARSGASEGAEALSAATRGASSHSALTHPLQIPIHPICTGNLFRAKRSQYEIKEYFVARFRIQLSRKDPLAFYHHPLQGPHTLLEGLFEELSNTKKAILRLTFKEWARWWMHRSTVRFQAAAIPWTNSVRIVESGQPKPDAFGSNTSRDVRFCVWQENETIQIKPKGEYQCDIKASRPFIDRSLLKGVDIGYLQQNPANKQRWYHMKSRILDLLGRIDK